MHYECTLHSWTYSTIKLFSIMDKYNSFKEIMVYAFSIENISSCYLMRALLVSIGYRTPKEIWSSSSTNYID